MGKENIQRGQKKKIRGKEVRRKEKKRERRINGQGNKKKGGNFI